MWVYVCVRWFVCRDASGPETFQFDGRDVTFDDIASGGVQSH